MLQNIIPRTLLVIQIIFGNPLKKHPIFHAGQVDQLASELIGPGNAAKVVKRLLEEGWIKERAAPARTEALSTMGRPPTRFYIRTPKGQREYARLANLLSSYGILLTS